MEIPYFSFCRKFLFSISVLMSGLTYAEFNPVFTLGLGGAHVNTNSTQQIMLIAPFENTYQSTHSFDDTLDVDLFVGLTIPVNQKMFWQLGFDFSQPINLTNAGDVYQFADPTYNNLSYDFKIQSIQLLAEAKLFYTCHSIMHPYVSLGVGEAINHAYGYNETPKSSDAVATPAAFTNRTYQSFSYAVGLGMDFDLSPHTRIGIGYRYKDLGKAGLGPIPQQDSNTLLTINNLTVNEVLLHFSYLL